MSDSDNISVGKLGKPHGVNGAFRFYLQRNLKNTKKLPKHFLVQEKGSLLPWFIAKIQWVDHNEGFITFEEITTPEKAKLYSGRELYLSPKDVATYFKKEEGEFEYLIGFTAIDEETGEIGIIEELIENPAQILMQVRSPKGEILIPLVDDFVVDVNEETKEIILTLPEGLLDL
jgi:16S rRNA processing protein RimM